jgi:glycosyltransferase involved in cell wall biosynthesis
MALLPAYVDVQAAQNPSHAGRGIARYSVQFTRAIAGAGVPLAGVALSPYHGAPTVDLPGDLATIASKRSAIDLRRCVSDDAYAYLLTSPMELALSPSRTLSTTSMTAADAVVGVIYDLIPQLFPDRYLLSPRSRRTYEARVALLPELDLVLAISEHTRRDAITHLGVDPARIAVVGAGASEHFTTPEDPGEARRVLRAAHPEIRAPFVLTVAAWEWRKNLESLVHGFARLDPALRKGRSLVVVCSGLPPGERTWHRVATEAGLSDEQFVVVGPVSDAVLRALYQSCELFVFPSRYEGFGLPVLEAACCGAPVVTSDASSLPEILRLPESTFSPDDVTDIAAVVERGITDEAFRDRLRNAARAAAADHTWDEVGRRAAAAWRGLRASPGRAGLAPRVAYLGRPTDPGVPAARSALGRDRFDVFQPGPVDGRTSGGVYPLEALQRLLDPLDYELMVWERDAPRVDPNVGQLVAQHPAAVAVGAGTGNSLCEAVGQLIRNAPVA